MTDKEILEAAAIPDTMMRGQVVGKLIEAT